MRFVFLFFIITWCVSLSAQSNTFPSSGAAGIGTTSPDQHLTINAATGNNSLISFKQNGVTNAYVGLGMDGVFRNETVGTQLQLNASGNNFISFYTNYAERLRLSADGNVGIGTNNPTHKLQVAGNLRTSGDISLYNSSTDGSRLTWYGGVNGTQGYRARIAPDGYLGFFPDEGIPTTLALTQNGKVGIGTTYPVNKLQVVDGHISAVLDDQLTGFTQVWDDNAIIWKHANTNGGLRFGSATGLNAENWSEKMRILDNGKTGFGTGTPSHKLTINTTDNSDGIWLNGNNKSVSLLTNAGQGSWNSLTQSGDHLLMWNGTSIDNTNAGGLVLGPWSNSSNGMRIASTGNVGIGTFNPGTYKLAVEGTIGARKVKVTQAAWADYVFEKEYHLPTLKEVEQFIQQHKHLPDVPSAKEVETNGLDLGDNQAILLKKIEELTLYIIQQEKRIELLEAKMKKD